MNHLKNKVMNKIQFTVTLEFADKITDDNEIIEVANNIARAISSEVSSMGIAPEDSDNYTVGGTIKPQFLANTIDIVI
jgi:hypothetical protein